MNAVSTEVSILRNRFHLFVWLIAFAVPYSTSAQFAFGIGGTSADHGSAIAIDDSDNIYITGVFTGTADFDPGVGVEELTVSGSGTFVASYDAFGTLIYAIAIGGASTGATDRGIAVDDAGNVYVTGSFSGLIDFDPGQDDLILNSSEGRIFVASYNSSGSLRYAFNVGGGISNIIEGGASIAVSGDNIFVTGTFNGEDDFDPDGDGTIIESSGNTDAFVAGYSAGSGTFRFAFAFGGAITDRGLGIATDASGNIFTTGAFRDTVDADPGPMESLLISEGDEDIYLASYSSTGEFRYALAVGSAGVNSPDRGQAVIADSVGNAYVTGYFGNTAGNMADFDPGVGDEILTSNGNGDLFVASYDTSGGLRFAISVGGDDPDRAYALAFDFAGNVAITGSFDDEVDFDPGNDEFLLGENGTHAFVATYSTTGAYAGAYYFESTGGTDGNEVGHGIAFGPGGLPHIVGTHSASVDLDPGPATVEVTTVGADDAFVTNFPLTAVAIEDSPELAAQLKLGAPYPNPSRGTVRVDVSTSSTQIVRAELFDALGRRVSVLYDDMIMRGTGHTLRIESDRLPAGMYFVRLKAGDGWGQVPIVVQ